MSVQITINHALKKYGDNVIIPDLSLQVKEGEFFTLLGSSGCGKTTLLRMIAGFNSIEGGEFYFNDKLINNIPPYKRNIGMVFQNYAVFPHMNAGKNVGYGLKQRGIKDPEYTQKVDNILNVMQISNLKDRMPTNMSGGQQQRVALARAIVTQPDVLLMDEPLSNLDAKLRIEMRLAIKRIQNQYKITTIYVTHDQEEALSMSDRIAVMSLGVIQQIGTPKEVYSHPKNLFVATFIGQSDIFEGKIVNNKGKKEVELYDGSIHAFKDLRQDLAEGTKVKCVVRPNDFTIASKGLKGKVIESIYLGSNNKYTIKLENEQTIEISFDAKLKNYNDGDEVFIDFDHNMVNIFDAETTNTVMEYEYE